MTDRAVGWQTDKDRLADSAAALQRKAAIYERLAAGVENDEDDVYNVDFFAKAGTLEEEAARIAREAAARGAGGLSTEPIDSYSRSMAGGGKSVCRDDL